MRQEYFGEIDYTTNPHTFNPAHLQESMHGKVILDGREIDHACYANTKTGVVKTYAVLPSGKPAPALGYHPADFPEREVACPRDGVLVETLRGAVKIFGPDKK